MSKIHGLSNSTTIMDGSDDPTSFASVVNMYGTGTVPAASVSAAAMKQALYIQQAGDANAISLSDINQGQIGDCFLLSSIGDIARLKPSFISNMIHANSNGTETVTLYVAGNGAPVGFGTTTFKAVTETVTNVFQSNGVNNGATQDQVNGVKEIWPQILEKAVATLDGGTGLNAISNGGNPVIAMEQLTGHAASWTTPASLTYASLVSDASANDLLVFDTLSGGTLTNGLFTSHAYMFEGLTGTGANAMVHLGNPWGSNQPTAILVSQLSRNFAEIDIGHLSA